ncbi:MAG: hypothetical protein K5859_05590 [Atopobiaceae bacterium]|nr:hypothetical protein [Atopobiaceae bacterium]
MKAVKTLGRIALCALALSAIPYQFKKDDETGTVEIRSLLWGLRKTPGEEHDNYAFAIPASGLDEDGEAEEAALAE